MGFEWDPGPLYSQQKKHYSGTTRQHQSPTMVGDTTIITLPRTLNTALTIVDAVAEEGTHTSSTTKREVTISPCSNGLILILTNNNTARYIYMSDIGQLFYLYLLIYIYWCYIMQDPVSINPLRAKSIWSRLSSHLRIRMSPSFYYIYFLWTQYTIYGLWETVHGKSDRLQQEGHHIHGHDILHDVGWQLLMSSFFAIL